MKSLLSLPPPPTLLTDRTDLPYFYTSCVHHGAFCPSKHIFFFSDLWWYEEWCTCSKNHTKNFEFLSFSGLVILLVILASRSEPSLPISHSTVAVNNQNTCNHMVFTFRIISQYLGMHSIWTCLGHLIKYNGMLLDILTN